MQNSLSMKVNRLFTKKRVSRMNRKDALTAGDQGSSKETMPAAEEALAEGR
jgi:hypothetical protein